MAYPPKIEQALKVLEAAGIPKRRAAPWLYRLLWRLGIPVRPPLFVGTIAAVLINVCVFACLYAGGYLLVHRALYGSERIDLHAMIRHGLGALIALAIVTAIRTERIRKFNLPRWSEIEEFTRRFD